MKALLASCFSCVPAGGEFRRTRLAYQLNSTQPIYLGVMSRLPASIHRILATMHSDSEHISLEQFCQGLHIYFNIRRSEW